MEFSEEIMASFKSCTRLARFNPVMTRGILYVYDDEKKACQKRQAFLHL
jgi:hypothetical protein